MLQSQVSAERFCRLRAGCAGGAQITAGSWEDMDMGASGHLDHCRNNRRKKIKAHPLRFIDTHADNTLCITAGRKEGKKKPITHPNSAQPNLRARRGFSDNQSKPDSSVTATGTSPSDGERYLRVGARHIMLE